MATNPIVNSLIFAGSVAESASIQAQGIAGGLTFLLPNTAPNQGNLMTVTAINGNNVFLGWSSPQSLSNIPLSDLAQSGATSGEFIAWDGTTWAPSSFVPGSGTVTSVALTVPSWLSVAGSPITTSGTLAVTAASGQPQNQVLATPNGSSGALSVRALVAADIPALPYDASGAAAAVAAQLPSTIAAVSHNFLTSYTAGTPGVFTAAQPSAADLSDSAASAGNVLRANGTAFVSAQLQFADLGGSLAVSQINSKVGTGNAVQLTNTGQTIVAGDVLTYTADGSVQDSGTLLSALALSANLPSSAGPTANNFVTAYNSGTHSFTLAQPSASNLSDGTTGTGAVVLAGAPTLTGTANAANLQASGFVAVTGNLDLSSGHGHIVQNTDIAGSITVNTGAASGSYTILGTYAAAPVVVASPTSDPAAAGATSWWVTSSTSTITINVAGTTTSPIVFNYVAMGN